VKIFQVDWHGPNRDVVLAALPEAGVRGTLQGAFKGSLAEGRTFAKDGSRMFGRGLAGYLMTLHRGTITFAFLVDDWMAEDESAMDALRARILSRFISG
ncbi:MAG: D-alanyl-D-alanine carboxypeptidase, partial [Candidatus Eremiobacteraeota bacterium]|nr:D-alanyl-D-alanine carboxypeptidase [Candidatus Eremiobacteraeota bacterium]